jgi:hypothetical protein
MAVAIGNVRAYVAGKPENVINGKWRMENGE